MRPEVMAAMNRNHGLLSRADAVGAGMTLDEVNRLVRTGAWRTIRRGVYALPETVEAALTWSDRQLLIDRAACMAITVPFVRSHTTAGLEIGLSLLLPPNAMTHVTRPCVGTHNKYGVKHHLAPYDPIDVQRTNGFEVLSPARTAVDIARHDGYPYGVVAVDSARWHGTSVDEIEQAMARMKFWSDRRAAVEAIEMSDGGAENAAESLSRTLLYEIGRTDVETQFGITDGVQEFWVDLRVGRHLIEFDGKKKYRPSSRGGLALVDPGDVVWDEKRREDFLRSFHLGMSRLEWSDVWGRGREAAKPRLDREIAATDRLWGRSIDDLERYRIHGKRRRAA